jgi:hypothetical protein
MRLADCSRALRHGPDEALGIAGEFLLAASRAEHVRPVPEGQGSGGWRDRFASRRPGRVARPIVPLPRPFRGWGGVPSSDAYGWRSSASSRVNRKRSRTGACPVRPRSFARSESPRSSTTRFVASSTESTRYPPVPSWSWRGGLERLATYGDLDGLAAPRPRTTECQRRALPNLRRRYSRPVRISALVLVAWPVPRTPAACRVRETVQ